MALLVGAMLSSAFVVQWRPQAAPVACRSGASAVTMFGEFMKKRPGDENSFVQTEMRGAVSKQQQRQRRRNGQPGRRLLSLDPLRHAKMPAARAHRRLQTPHMYMSRRAVAQRP